MQRKILCAAASCMAASLGLGLGVAVAQRTTRPPSAARGRGLFVTVGCYQCHGHRGEGTAAPRLAPDPLPREVFTRILRNPLNVMPVYTAAVLPDADVADIYAYLSGIAVPKSAAEIPLLNQ